MRALCVCVCVCVCVVQVLTLAKLEGLADFVYSCAQSLSEQKTGSAAELNDKFASSAKFQMTYGSLSLFYGGLESLLGPPKMYALSLQTSLGDTCHALSPWIWVTLSGTRGRSTKTGRSLTRWRWSTFLVSASPRISIFHDFRSLPMAFAHPPWPFHGFRSPSMAFAHRPWPSLASQARMRSFPSLLPPGRARPRSRCVISIDLPHNPWPSITVTWPSLTCT